MAKGKFAEARLWLTAGTVTMLFATWAALAVQDAIARQEANEDSDAGAGTAQLTQPSRATHTRTRGS
jgi:hypothetical protein